MRTSSLMTSSKSDNLSRSHLQIFSNWGLGLQNKNLVHNSVRARLTGQMEIDYLTVRPEPLYPRSIPTHAKLIKGAVTDHQVLSPPAKYQVGKHKHTGNKRCLRNMIQRRINELKKYICITIFYIE